MEDGYTKEEWKVLAETKKMLDPTIKVTCTAVRVPVFIGHSESVNIEFENEITAEEARNILRERPGCLVIDKHEDGGYITPYESPVKMRPTSPASAKTRPSRTASTCGLSPTTCARAPRSTRSRSPRFL
jgi:aspartate-semialdehyde dehydrogenase